MDRPHRLARRRAAALFSAAVVMVCAGSSPSVLAAQDPHTSAVRVHVVDAETGEPVPGVALRISDRARSGTAGQDGSVLFAELPPGPVTVIAARFGYRENREIVTLRTGRTVEISITLIPSPVEMAPVTVRAVPQRPSRMDDFERRRRGPVGHFFTYAQIQEARPRMTSDLLRRVPGMRVHCGTGPCTVRSARASTPRCPLQVFVDGIAAFRMSPDEIPVTDLEGVEIYRGAAELPPQFNRGTSQCGAVVIWTADPDRRRERR